MLAELPDDLVGRLELSELVVPTPELAVARSRLEERLGHHVVTYRAGPPAPSPSGTALHLCTLLQPAALAGDDLAALRGAEADAPGVLLVAYEQPLSLRPGAGAGA
ncbi:hypothetical protein E1212_00735 [Jiangella ureilytica]|uniref:Uncharacterized protein n=1 Tax=Jiangella ureilytica TaxID=2530374 RepID=A0A4R4S3Z8_9ACTN|nr:hypothetical protein [Jiangella ureilytica]TDC57016.1 hypothetical protein E1212_00735 [Jiangella ureilytica]